MPPVAVFVEKIDGSQKQIAEDRAETQAAKVLNAIQQLGYYDQPTFADHITNDLVNRRFGWAALCEMAVDKTSFFVKDFKAAYLAHDRTEKRELIELDVDPDVKKLVEKIGGG